MSLHVIGLGVAEQALLSEPALKALQAASLVIGSERQLDTVRWWLSSQQQVEVLPKLKHLKTQLHEYVDVKGECVALLASGDPLFYGIGRWVANTFPDMANDTLQFHPAVSSVQVACHKKRWSLQDVSVISLHGRPALKLKTVLRKNQKFIVLTDSKSCPRTLAQLCIDSGLEDSEITVYEALGYPNERTRTFAVKTLAEAKPALTFDALNICCIETKDNTTYLPCFPGIDDTHFITDKDKGKGMLTKREVRLNILSLLHAQAGDNIWDIGAGCGGVAVELSYWAPHANIYAVEHHPERLRCLTANRERFGVISNLHIIEHTAPEVLADLPVPTKVFIGGSGGKLESILRHCWESLPTGGILVASAVTEASRYTLHTFYHTRQSAQDSQSDTFDVSVSRGEQLAGELLYRPSLAVRLFKFTKQQPVQSNIADQGLSS